MPRGAEEPTRPPSGQDSHGRSCRLPLRPWHRRDPNPDPSLATSPPAPLKDADLKTDPLWRVRGAGAPSLTDAPVIRLFIPRHSAVRFGGTRGRRCPGTGTWLLWGGPTGDSGGLCPPPAWSPDHTPRGGRGVTGGGRRGTLRQRSRPPCKGLGHSGHRRAGRGGPRRELGAAQSGRCVRGPPPGPRQGARSGARQARPLRGSGGRRAPRAGAVPFSLAAARP